MKKVVGVVLFVCGVVLLGYSQCAQLVWSDEFNGTSLSTANWGYNIGTGSNGWGNAELQYYTNSTQNVLVENGNLHIIARHQPNYNNTGSNYTSGRILTAGKQNFKYGRIEARIKLPSADKAWPAFWMLPENGNWPRTGEIDIMEARGINPTQWLGTIHYYSGSHQYTGVNYTNPTPLSNDFHTYAVEWSPKEIKFFVDSTFRGALTPSSTVGNAWPFDSGNNFFIILNVAVGGNFVGGGTPSPTLYPDTMVVDWVRVHKIESSLYIDGPTKVSQGYTNVPYVCQDYGNSASYTWSITPGASVTGTNGLKNTSINYGTTTTAGRLQVAVSVPGCPNSFSYGIPIQIDPITCTRTLDNFENVRSIGNYQGDGSFSVGANPSVSVANTSSVVGQYVRNAGVTYDALVLSDYYLGNLSDYVFSGRRLVMDVYSTAPANTPISLQLESSVKDNNPYPAGRHSIYTANTGAPNTWNRLVFSYSQRPDPNTTNDEVDLIKILVNPNSNTNHTYYFDNIGYQSTATPSISGVSSVCVPNSILGFSVNTLSGSSYVWSVPSTSSILGTSIGAAVSVLWKESQGNVTVTETNRFNCVGTGVRSIASGACTASLEDQSASSFAKLYPNPVEEVLQLELDERVEEIRVKSADGRTVYEAKTTSRFLSIDMSLWPSGIYILENYTIQKSISHHKIVKK